MPKPVHPHSETVDETRCTSSRDEDRILCDASSAKDASIRQVIAEDETTNSETPSDPQPDVWTTAYKQWVQGEAVKQPPKAVYKAMKEALKRHPDAKMPDGNNDSQPDANIPDLDDDELTLITKAVRAIAGGTGVQTALELIEDLCYSGDNGRQMVAAGGMPHLLKLAQLPEIDHIALKALATCAQNNPAVFNAAVEAGAIAQLLRLSVEKEALIPEILRVLVAVADGNDAVERMHADAASVIALCKNALRGTEEDNATSRRAIRRAFALLESLLVKDNSTWREQLQVHFLKLSEKRLKSTDLDIREGAARVLQLLRKNE